MTQTYREVSCWSETTLIAMFQIISGGAVIAALAQADTLVDIAGYDSLRILLTAMIGALLAAICAAYFRYQCRYWGSRLEGNTGDGEPHEKCAARIKRYQGLTRAMLVLSLIGIAAGLVVLLAAFWLGNPLPQNDDEEYRTTFVMKT